MVENLSPYGNVIGIKSFEDPVEAYDYVLSLYNESCQDLTNAFTAATENPRNINAPKNAHYPFVGIRVPADSLQTDSELSYGAVDGAGIYGTTLTRPELFKDYYIEQFQHLIRNHKVSLEVGLSGWPIPLPFVIDGSVTPLKPNLQRRINVDFALPNLSFVNDDIANCKFKPRPNRPRPLALFSAERVDFSLNRLHHYTSTSPHHFQSFILLTNYHRYTEHFCEYARELVAKDKDYTAFVEPGDVITHSPFYPTDESQGEAPRFVPQMPAYHLKRKDGMGITFINIGVGPSNAKTITDHLAVLRPHCWIMVGHCGGLRRSQQLGDYVLAHAYQREDHVMDADIQPWVPIPPIAEIQVALQKAVANITNLKGDSLKKRLRTGTVATVDNRNWELRSQEMAESFNQSRSIAVDMESATIAANGFRFRVPYGTLLCVSDKPIHGEIKFRGMANAFYQKSVEQHLLIGLETIRLLREEGVDQIHSRKLRGFDDPAFR